VIEISRVVMVCTANICRSPMAEAIWQHQFPNIQCTSRGVAAMVGEPAHEHTVEVCAANGTPVTATKRAQSLTGIDVQAASLILAMDNSHKHMMQSRFPSASGKIWLLGHWGQGELSDPIGKDAEAYVKSYAQIIESFSAWAKKLSIK
jgi:protein-tyrosine phosphatase